MTKAGTYTCPDLCRGTGVYPRRGRGAATCPSCRGSGQVIIDPAAINAALLVTRGPRTGALRRSRPTLPVDGGVYGAAYVWRLIRFHAGLDMHLPVLAGFYIGVGGLLRADTDRPILAALDALVDRFGADLFGKASMLRATARWGHALYGDQKITDANHASTAIGGISFGQLADALSVYRTDGLDLGGFTESPEAALQAATDLDGVLDQAAIEEMLAEHPRAD